MNKWKGFKWTKECALAFQQLKKYLSRPPIMSSPEMDEVMFAYVAVAPHAVSWCWYELIATYKGQFIM